MRYAKMFFILGATAAIAGSGTAAVTAQTAKRMIPISATINDLVGRLDAAIRKELSEGCTAVDARGKRSLCGDSKTAIDALHDETAAAADALGARPAGKRESALLSIRAFRRDPALDLSYKSTVSNPYRDDDSLIETYADSQGNEYWIDPAADVLVQMGPYSGGDTPAQPTRPEDRRSVAELRAAAMALAEANVAGFAARKSSFHPLEDNKDRKTYFFRWDDFSTPAKESEMPPFLQIGLAADGRLVSYTNTLTR